MKKTLALLLVLGHGRGCLRRLLQEACGYHHSQHRFHQEHRTVYYHSGSGRYLHL